MNLTFKVGGRTHSADLSKPHDISTRLEFADHRSAEQSPPQRAEREEGPGQPNAFGIDEARAWPFSVGDWVGDTRHGGSVNCFVVQLCPHGNGTHTECVGHIVDERVAIADILEDTLMTAWVATVAVEPLGGVPDEYSGPHDASDEIVPVAALEEALADCPEDVDALVIRTHPNPPEKAHRHFSGNNPVYLTNDAMKLIRQRDFKHLLVDFPSVDREEDGGELPNHRIYWDVEPGAHEFENVPSAHTITEMIYVPAKVADGLWAMTIQIPDFVLDAAPSRVRLFPVQSPP
jgi:kynurenine formamidase